MTLSFDEFSVDEFEQRLAELAGNYIPKMKQEHTLKLRLLAEITGLVIRGLYPNLKKLSTETESPVTVKTKPAKNCEIYVRTFFHSKDVKVEAYKDSSGYTIFDNAVPYMRLEGIRDVIFDYDARRILMHPDKVRKLRELNAGDGLKQCRVKMVRDGIAIVRTSPEKELLFFEVGNYTEEELRKSWSLEVNVTSKTLWQAHPSYATRYYTCDDYVLVSDKMLSPDEIPPSLKRELLLKEI